jgi:hypothetical protein
MDHQQYSTWLVKKAKLDKDPQQYIKHTHS